MRAESGIVRGLCYLSLSSPPRKVESADLLCILEYVSREGDPYGSSFPKKLQPLDLGFFFYRRVGLKRRESGV